MLSNRLKSIMVKQIEVEVNHTVEDVRESIDEISNDSFFTYGWFKTLESFGRIPEPFYLTLNAKKNIVAFVPCFLDKADDFFDWGPNIFPFLRRLLRAAQKFGFFKENVMLCYSPACCRTKVFFADKYDDETILDLFTREIDVICKKHRILFSSFLFVSEFDDPLMKNLEHLNYVKFPNVVTYYLDVKWSNFDSYLQSLKGRTSIKREIKDFMKSGVAIKEESISEEIAEKLSKLSANTFFKHGQDESTKLDPSFFMKLAMNANDKIRLLVARKDDKIIGFALFLQHKDMLDGYINGFDYTALTDVHFLYWNLWYYKPIQLAIDEKIKKIYYRYFQDRAKISRGCKPEQTYTFVRCHNLILGPFVNSLLKNRAYSRLKSRFLRDYFKNL